MEPLRHADREDEAPAQYRDPDAAVEDRLAARLPRIRAKMPRLAEGAEAGRSPGSLRHRGPDGPLPNPPRSTPRTFVLRLTERVRATGQHHDPIPSQSHWQELSPQRCARPARPSEPLPV